MTGRALAILALVLALAGCGRGDEPMTSRPQAVKRVANLLTSAASAIKGVRDNASAEEAAQQIARSADAIDAIGAAVRDLPAPDQAELDALEHAQGAFSRATRTMNDAVDTLAGRLKDPAGARITSAAFSLELMRLQLSVSEFALSLNPADAKALNRARGAAGLQPGPPTGVPPMPVSPEGRAQPGMSPEERLNSFLAAHGAEYTAIIRADGVPVEQAAALAEHVRVLAGAHAVMQSTRDGRTIIAVAPVADIDALRAAVDFGAAGTLTGREFSVTIDPAKLPKGP